MSCNARPHYHYTIRTGMHLTGTAVACLRRWQQWNLASILHEYRMFADSKSRYVTEQYIELFDCDLITDPTPHAHVLLPPPSALT